MSTIAAISTPIGVGGISVIRLSGKDAKNIASKVFCLSKIKDFDIEPRKMYLGEFKAENFNEKCMMVWFKAPYSYTGEDVVEFHDFQCDAVRRETDESLVHRLCAEEFTPHPERHIPCRNPIACAVEHGNGLLRRPLKQGLRKVDSLFYGAAGTCRKQQDEQ